MKTATTIQENAEDILADAKAINEEREAAEDVVVEDESCECKSTQEEQTSSGCDCSSVEE